MSNMFLLSYSNESKRLTFAHAEDALNAIRVGSQLGVQDLVLLLFALENTKNTIRKLFEK